MKSSAIFAVGVLIGTSGCSSLIYGIGTDTTDCETREQVRKKFGTPTETGDHESGSFDRFQTRRKIADPMTAGRQSITAAMTLGLSELINAPAAFMNVTYRIIASEELTFSYDRSGRVIFASYGNQSIVATPSSSVRSEEEPEQDKPASDSLSRK